MHPSLDRRRFLTLAGTTLGLATVSSASLTALLNQVVLAGETVKDLKPEAAAGREDFWFEIQRSFNTTRGMMNLNNGYCGTCPKLVTEADCKYIVQQEDVPVYTMAEILGPQTETIRTGLAELFGCDKEEIAITRSASESLEILLFGIDFKSGDEILTTTQDYPRMLTTLRQREQRENLTLKMIQIPAAPKKSDEVVDAFAKAITPKTRVILMSHIVFLTGQILPVKAVCDLAHSKGIEVIVDGAHSFANIDFRYRDLGCDYFGSSLHKWLLAPKGTGLLFVKRDKIEKLWPLMAATKKQASDIRKYEEIGTHSVAPRLAIGEALLFHRGITPSRKEARLRYLSRYWMAQLKDDPKMKFYTSSDPHMHCASTTFSVEGIDPEALAKYLKVKHKIVTVAIKHEEIKGLRITPGLFTTLNELDRFCDIVKKVSAKGLPA